MKIKFWLILFASLLSSHLFAQTGKEADAIPVEDSVFTVIEVMP